MAEQGNGSENLTDSFIASSDTVYDICCDVCAEDDKQQEATGFCVECRDYLCQDCVKAHSKQRPSRNHVIQTRSQMPCKKPPPPLPPRNKPATGSCTEICDKHPGRQIEYFCKDEATLACSVCLVKHRHCHAVDHISDLTDHLLDSPGYQQFTASLKTLERKSNDVIKNAQNNTIKANTLCTDVSSDLLDLRRKVTQTFDKFDNGIKLQTDAIKSEDLKKMKDIDDKGKSVLSEVGIIFTELQDLENNNKLNQLFVRMVKLEDRVQALHNVLVKTDRKNTVTTYKFKPGTAEQDLLDKPESFGELAVQDFTSSDSLSSKLEVPRPNARPLVQFQELEVARESVKLQKKLGSGVFGEVYAGKLRKTVDVFVKELKKGQVTVDEFLAEAKLLNHLRHLRIVEIMAVCTKTEPIWIITELMANGSLLDVLRNDQGRTLSFQILRKMAEQIADGMTYLEEKNYVHRDLRAHSILVGEHNEVKIASFGMAKLTQGGIYQMRRDETFPVKWIAPDACSYLKISIKSEVWSFGVLLWELITFGKVPYQGMSNVDTFEKVERGYRMPKPSGGPVPCPDLYYEIMLKCWNPKPERRPTFAYLKDFFYDYPTESEGK